MSVRKLTANLLTALALMAGFTTVQAQQYLPIQDPFAFDPDFRWFEPIYDMDLADMKPSKRANTGWFATYDRLHMYASRPDLDDPNTSSDLLDGGMGHRYELGLMTPYEDTGWTFTFTDIAVGEFFTVPHERINRYRTDIENPAPPFGLESPAADGNTPGLNTRTYFVQDSENVVSMDSYEIAKTWRMEPFHYGGILEPMVGFRWLRVNDLNARQVYTSSLDLDQIPFELTPGGGETGEQLITDGTFTENELITAQGGFRYTKFRDRFMFTSDFRVFTGGSFQSSKSNRLTEITLGGEGADSSTDNILTRVTTPIYTSNEEYTIGFDWRGELAYQLTRDFTIRCGYQIIDIESGIWRGGPQDTSRNQLLGGPTDQDLFLVGGSVGITINR